MWSYFKFGPVDQKEMSFKEKVYGGPMNGGDKEGSQQLTLSLPLIELKLTYLFNLNILLQPDTEVRGVCKVKVFASIFVYISFPLI